LADCFNSDELIDDRIHNNRSYLLAKSQISAKLISDEAVSGQHHYKVSIG
jgi:hypothetical protein